MPGKKNLKRSDFGPSQLRLYVQRQKESGVPRAALPKPSVVFDDAGLGISKFFREHKPERKQAKACFDNWYKNAINEAYGSGNSGGCK